MRGRNDMDNYVRWFWTRKIVKNDILVSFNMLGNHNKYNLLDNYKFIIYDYND